MGGWLLGGRQGAHLGGGGLEQGRHDGLLNGEMAGAEGCQEGDEGGDLF